MGFLDDLLGEVSYTEDELSPDFARALQGMLGGDEEAGLGLDGLLERLRAAGFEGIVQSWLGSGTSLPIAPDQIAEALGDADVQTMAGRVEMTPEAFLGALADHLPGLVDRLSPSGQLLPAGAGATSTV